MKNQIRKFILGWIVNAVAIALASYWVNEFVYDGLITLAVVSLLFGIVALLLKPIVKIISLPLFFLGPIMFFIADAVVLYALDFLSEGFAVGDIVSLAYAAIIIGAVNYLAHWLV